MMEEKYCIVHFPNYIDPNGKSGSSIRPMKMIKAFQDCGYNVDWVMGYGTERKKYIGKIKQNIERGRKYDFIYSESSTMPTLLTEKDHIPRYPLLDFGFMSFCKKKGIKLGLFYRDIQWKFPIYQNYVPWYKKIFSLPLYRYDLWKYRSLVDVFYLPTMQMSYYLKEEKSLLNRVKILMPGADNTIKSIEQSGINSNKSHLLYILYVGGVDRIYNLKVFLHVIQKLGNKVCAVICCREKEWETAKRKYLPYLSSNIYIIHESGDGLKPYYQTADLCCAFAGTDEYMKMAMPVKIFEYLGNLTPIISTKGTAAGEFVENEDIGWTVEYNEEELTKCLSYIVQHPECIAEKKKNELRILENHTWKARAKQVIRDLK